MQRAPYFVPAAAHFAFYPRDLFDQGRTNARQCIAAAEIGMSPLLSCCDDIKVKNTSLDFAPASVPSQLRHFQHSGCIRTLSAQNVLFIIAAITIIRLLSPSTLISAPPSLSTPSHLHHCYQHCCHQFYEAVESPNALATKDIQATRSTLLKSIRGSQKVTSIAFWSIVDLSELIDGPLREWNMRLNKQQPENRSHLRATIFRHLQYARKQRSLDAMFKQMLHER